MNLDRKSLQFTPNPRCRTVLQSPAKGLDQGFLVKYGMEVQEAKAAQGVGETPVIKFLL